MLRAQGTHIKRCERQAACTLMWDWLPGSPSDSGNHSQCARAGVFPPFQLWARAR
jgi:hypothetical protein